MLAKTEAEVIVKFKIHRQFLVALSLTVAFSAAGASNLCFGQETKLASQTPEIKVVNGTTHESVELSSFPMGTSATKVIPASRVPVSMPQQMFRQQANSGQVIPRQPAPQFPIVTSRELANPIQRNWAVTHDATKSAQPLFSQSYQPMPIISAEEIPTGATVNSLEQESQFYSPAPSLQGSDNRFGEQIDQVKLASMQNGADSFIDAGVPIVQGHSTASANGELQAFHDGSLADARMSFSQPGFEVGNADLFPVYEPPLPEITGAAFALPQPRTFSLFGGWGFQDEDRPFGEGGFYFPTLLDDGYLVGMASGRRWSPRLRTELEFSYRRNEAERFYRGLTVLGYSSIFFPSPFVQGEVHAYSGMANVYFDFDRERGKILTPYVGTGIGMTFLDADVTEGGYRSSGETISDESMFAFQVMAGVSANLGPRTDFFMEYRFFKTTIDDFSRPDSAGPFSSWNPQQFDYGFEESNLIMGLRLKY